MSIGLLYTMNYSQLETLLVDYTRTINLILDLPLQSHSLKQKRNQR